MTMDFSRSTTRNSWPLLTLICGLLLSSSVHADDITGINGLWATDARNCDKIFSKTEHGFAFSKDSGSVRERFHH